MLCEHVFEKNTRRTQTDNVNVCTVCILVFASDKDMMVLRFVMYLLHVYAISVTTVGAYLFTSMPCVLIAYI